MLAPLSLLIASLLARVQLSRVQALAAGGLFLAACFAADFGRLDLLWQGSTTFPPAIAVAILLVIALFLIARAPMPGLMATLALLALLSATTRPDKLGIAVWAQGYVAGTSTGASTAAWRTLRPTASRRFRSFGAISPDRCGRAWRRTPMIIAFPIRPLPQFTPPNDPGYRPGAENFTKGDYFVMVPTDSAALAVALQQLSSRDSLP